MGRSTASCFKIISCGGSDESVDIDDIHASSQNKDPDKRGWSFRKRSARHRVLSNTIVTEIPSSGNKETSEPVSISSAAQVTSSISEKTPDDIWTEEIPRLSNSNMKDTTVSNMATEASCEDDNKSETVPDESAVLVIQAAVRRFLAQKQLVNNKNIVKLQAVVRGHLVRSHAVGTLRCVQAIVKIQSLVRARRANLFSEKTSDEEKGVQNPGINSPPIHISVEKLLSNSLARKLLESTPRTKQINVKCDPLKSDSAWKWLERWMSASTPETMEVHAPEQDQDKVDDTENQVKTLVSSHHESADMESEVAEATGSSEKHDDLITTERNSYARNEEENNHVCVPDEPLILKTEAPIAVNSIPDKPKPEPEPEPEPTAKTLATDQVDSEVRKSVFGSRKASNSAFIAAQSRFEELTSKNNPLKPVNSSTPDSSDHDNKTSSSADVIPAPENATPATNLEPEGSLVSRNSPEVRNGGSECGTELSVTSTLDSPDQNNIGIKKLEEESEIVNDAIELEPESEHQIYEIVPQISEASPRSHITVPESQGTPSSHVSTNTKKTKIDNNSQKRKSWSTSKKSPVSSSVDSGLRSSLDQFPKEPKSGKRRNSFGSPRSEEPRDSSGNSSLPSYMQATESARAKAINNGSPRSSPDVQDKETFLKKRHSLPGNGRQGSPHVKRSMSQTLQTTKVNGNQERKWQR